MRRALIAGTVAAAGAAIAYQRLVKPWQERWGATDDEVTASLPDDDLVAEPASQATRAISINATPEQIWPWLVQIGADRGGFYSYDWMENLVGLRIHSADRIVDEWQQLSVGDVVHATGSRAGGWYVVDLIPNEALVMQVADLKAGRPVGRDDAWAWQFQWTFALRPDPAGGTRLLIRERTGFGSDLVRRLMAPIGMASFVMTRRMLLGIQERAERTA